MEMTETQTKKCRCCGEEKPISAFRQTRLGVMHTCSECVRRNQVRGKADKKLAKMESDKAAEARAMRLEAFTPRELLERLRDLGYEGELFYTRVERINLAKL